MALNIASLIARRLRDSSKCVRLLAELSNLCVHVTAVQETHFTCETDYQVVENDFVVFSAFDSRWSAGISLGRSLGATVFASDRGRLVVADVAVKTFEFWVAAVYAPNSAAERRPFFRRLGSSKRTVLVGDWNAILDLRKRLVGSGRCDSSLINLLAKFDLIDRFRLDQPGREMWT